ncbi:MAG TPA: hypothetical protein DHW40_06845 [Microbacterium sp.]|nr:hypothetical protein [Microbacterium sp.]
MNETAPPEVATTRLISLFSRAVEIALPALLADDGAVPERFLLPVRGRLAQPPIARPVRRSVVLLRSRMTEPWTVGRLAAEVAVSRAHLTRVFTQQVGVAPMRFLIETRLTEFTRLIEETDLPIADAGVVLRGSSVPQHSSLISLSLGLCRRPLAPRVTRDDVECSWLAISVREASRGTS